MTDRPILFSSPSAPMVRALLAGTKTQTRRLIKPTSQTDGFTMYPQYLNGERIGSSSDPSFCDLSEFAVDPSKGLYISGAPYCPGDRLWVREAWRCNGWASDVATIFYRASEGDGYTAMCEQYPVAGNKPLRVTGTWRPGIHMPRWASRLTLTVTEVSVQRLQEISNEDCIAEGIPLHSNENAPRVGHAIDDFARNHGLISHYGAEYRRLWDSINADRAPWDSNPWVCAITFKTALGNIDAMPEPA